MGNTTKKLKTLNNLSTDSSNFNVIKLMDDNNSVCMIEPFFKDRRWYPFTCLQIPPTNHENCNIEVFNMEIANVYFRNAINNSFGINKSGADLTEGFKLAKSVIGTKGQRKNFMAVLDNVADAHTFF